MPEEAGRLMPRWWRLLFALALIAMISAAVFPPSGDADSPGIFTDGVGIMDLDDDFDEAMRRLRPEVTAHTPASLFDLAPPYALHCFHGPVGAEPGIGTGRIPADRGPPARSQISPTSSASPASSSFFGGLHAFLTQPSQAPGNTDRSCTTRFFARSTGNCDHHFLIDHRPRTERNRTWPA